MGDKCNCYRFSPRDSLSGAVAQIADYLSKHPGWNETELRAFVDGLISAAGVETFNGRSGNVTLNKDDVNNLLIANCYFAEADETIESIDVLALYKLGIRIVFTQYSSEVDGYTLAYGIEYYPTTDTAKAYLFSSGSGGVGAVVSVNGKTGTVVLKASDILMNNGDSVEHAVSNAKAIDNAAYSPDNPPPYPVTSVNGKIGTVTGLYDKNNPPPYPVNSVNSKTGSVMLKVVDVSNGNSTDENAYIFIDESDDYPDVIASDSSKLGGQLPSYYASAEALSSLKNDIGDAWASGTTYAVGDYCISGNQLYKCKTAHTAGSAFSADYWDAANVSNEIKQALSGISELNGIRMYAYNVPGSNSNTDITTTIDLSELKQGLYMAVLVGGHVDGSGYSFTYIGYCYVTSYGFYGFNLTEINRSDIYTITWSKPSGHNENYLTIKAYSSLTSISADCKILFIGK